MSVNNTINAPTPFDETIGGTGNSTYSTGDLLYASASNTLSKLTGNGSASQRQLLSMISNIPSWFVLNAINEVGDVPTYTIQASDYGKVLYFTPLLSGPVTVTLPQQSTLTTNAGFFFYVICFGASSITFVKQGSETIIGNDELLSGQSCKIDRVTSTIWSVSFNVASPLPMSEGGTGKALVAADGGIVYTDANSMEILAPTATGGQVLLSGANANPAWSIPTYPGNSDSAGRILRSDGTNVVYSVPTFPDTATTGNIIYASASDTYSVLAPNTSATQTQFLSMLNSVPSWLTLNAINTQTGTTYTVQLSDYGKLITLNNASAVTVTLPQQSTTTTSAGFFVWLRNIGSGLVTVVKQGAETLDGNFTMATGSQMLVNRPTTTSWVTFGGTSTLNFEFSVMGTTATANQVFTFTENASCDGTILSCAQAAASFGTAGTYTVAINGSTVTGLSAITNTTSRTITNATAANTFVVGDIITITMGGTVATGVSYIATLNYSRSF